jgi:PilZ domain
MLDSLTHTRRYTRFNVISNNVVNLELLIEPREKLTFNALMLDSSAGGLQVLLVSRFPLQLQQLLRVDFDEFVSLSAKIIWIKPLEDYIFKVGIEYID